MLGNSLTVTPSRIPPSAGMPMADPIIHPRMRKLTSSFSVETAFDTYTLDTLLGEGGAGTMVLS